MLKKIKNEKLIFILSLLFSFSFPKQFLLYPSQTSHMIWGLGKSNLNYFYKDWMASQTTNPFPLFSTIVTLTYNYGHEYLFYLYHSIIIFFFIYFIILINLEIFKINKKENVVFLIFLIILLLYSPLTEYIIENLFNSSRYFIILTNGIAGFTLLINTFEPALFGIFLIPSIYFFLKNKIFLSIVFVGISCNVHPIYFLPSFFLVLSYGMYYLIIKKDLNRFIFIGLISILSVLPNLIYTFLVFKPTSNELIEVARDILINFRVPHHTLPENFFGKVTILKSLLFLLLLAYLFFKKKIKIFFPLFFLSLGILLISVFAISFQNKLVTLMMPWRSSIFIFPFIPVFFLTALLSKYLLIKVKHEYFKYITITCILVLFIFGFHKTYNNIRHFDNYKFWDVYEFVHKNKSINDVYLIHPAINDKSLSDELLNFSELFLTKTGAQTFINFSVHPFKDNDIIEWYKRVKIADRIFKNNNLNCHQLIDTISEYKITHIVIKLDDNKINCQNFEVTYTDNYYSIYKVTIK